MRIERRRPDGMDNDLAGLLALVGHVDCARSIFCFDATVPTQESTTYFALLLAGCVVLPAAVAAGDDGEGEGERCDQLRRARVQRASILEFGDSCVQTVVEVVEPL